MLKETCYLRCIHPLCDARKWNQKSQVESHSIRPRQEISEQQLLKWAIWIWKIPQQMQSKICPEKSILLTVATHKNYQTHTQKHWKSKAPHTNFIFHSIIIWTTKREKNPFFPSNVHFLWSLCSSNWHKLRFVLMLRNIQWEFFSFVTLKIHSKGMNSEKFFSVQSGGLFSTNRNFCNRHKTCDVFLRKKKFISEIERKEKVRK